jgi:hypothetical protein
MYSSGARISRGVGVPGFVKSGVNGGDPRHHTQCLQALRYAWSQTGHKPAAISKKNETKAWGMLRARDPCRSASDIHTNTTVLD